MSQIVQAEESIKLYEFEPSKPDLDEEFIKHHQALGAHWGIYNGPPYPLSRRLSTGKRLKSAAKGVSGDGSGSVTRKKRRALKKARKTRAKNLKIKTMEKQTKEEIIKNKDLKSMLQNVDKFTNKEITDLLDRLGVERRLREEISKQEQAKKTWGKKVREGVKTTIKEQVPKTINSMIKTGADAGIKLASNRILKEMVGPKATNKYGDKWQDVIDKLIPDIMQKKKEEEKKK